jgi:hypothetical protein
VIARRRRFGGLRQHRKRSGEGIGVVVRLFGAALVAAVGPNRLKVSFSRRSETRYSAMHDPHSLLEGGRIERLRFAAVFAFDQGLTQRFDLLLVFFRQPQAGMHDLARRTVATDRHLTGNEAIEVIAQRKALCFWP